MGSAYDAMLDGLADVIGLAAEYPLSFDASNMLSGYDRAIGAMYLHGLVTGGEYQDLMSMTWEMQYGFQPYVIVRRHAA